MATHHRINVNFFLVAPVGSIENDYTRLRACSNSFDENALEDFDRSRFLKLSSERIIRRDGFITGALKSCQTGGFMPLKQSRGGQLSSAVEEGEGLTYPVCFIYDINRSVLLMETLTKGASPADWCQYFFHQFYKQALRPPRIGPHIIEKTTSAELLEDLDYILSFEVAVAGFRRNDLFAEQSNRWSLGEISNIAQRGRAGKVKCQMSVDVQRRNKDKKRPQQETLDSEYILDIINSVSSYDDVEMLKVRGLYTEEDPSAAYINLLDFRLTDSVLVPMEELTDKGLNLGKRVSRLLEVYQKHESILRRYDPNNVA